MNWFTGFVVYFLVWWTVLFAILPLGIRPDPEGRAPGGWRGAPETPRLGRTALWTTIVSAVIFLGLYALIRSDWMSFRHGWLAMPAN